MDFSVLEIKDKKIKRVVNINLLISFFICISSIIILWIHNIYFISFNLFYIGIELFKAGLFAGVFTYMNGVVFDNFLNFK